MFPAKTLLSCHHRCGIIDPPLESWAHLVSWLPDLAQTYALMLGDFSRFALLCLSLLSEVDYVCQSCLYLSFTGTPPKAASVKKTRRLPPIVTLNSYISLRHDEDAKNIDIWADNDSCTCGPNSCCLRLNTLSCMTTITQCTAHSQVCLLGGFNKRSVLWWQRYTCMP